MFRLLNVSGRAALEVDGHWYDLARVSGDTALADPMAAVARFDDLHAVSASCAAATPDGSAADAVLEAPVPRPRQVFAIGLNYANHAAESGMAPPPAPLTFTKFPSSIAGPTADVPLSGEMVDWEVEIVVVIGRTCSSVAVDGAWDVVAGLTLGQDISDRSVQMTGIPPLVAYLSSICTLEPGDLIFTGTPDGVGMARGRFLAEDDVIVSGAEGIGELRNTCVAGRGALPL